MSKAIILTLLFSISAFAENHMLFLGGGSEPETKETTIFDNEVKAMGSFLEKNKSWNTKVSFNGGHSVTEKILSEKFPRAAGPNAPFTESNFKKLISEYERKIDSGEIKSGDQLLVYITTHGAQKTDKELSHKIGMSGKSATDLNDLSGADLVSMDVLQSLITKAEAKGIKLGVMDFSCHAGASLALKNPNTCIITASGPKHFGFASWGMRFAQNMKKGQNLEDIFLKTFQNRYETAFPMISTPAGTEVQDNLYSLLSPYLYYYKPSSDKLAGFLEKQVINNQCEEADASYSELLSLLDDMRPVLKKGALQNLKSAIAEYHQFQKSIKNDLKKMSLGDMVNTREKFCTGHSCSEWSQKEILQMNYDKLKTQYTEIKNSSQGHTKKWYEGFLSNLDQARARKYELIRQNPQLSKYENYYKTLPQLEQKSWAMAMKVSRQIQEVYPAMYKEASSRAQGKNPCRNFVL